MTTTSSRNAFTIAFVLTQRADAIRNGKMTSEETTT